MNAKVFSFLKLHQNSVIPSVHIARFVGKTLDVPLCWDETIGDDPLDVLIIIGGAYAFAGSELLAALGKAIVEAKRVVWVQNDFTVIPPKPVGNANSPFRKAFRDRHTVGMEPIDYWTTVQKMAKAGPTKDGYVVGPGSVYVNWNALSTTARDVKPIAERTFAEKMVYYGSLREHREHMFVKYFRNPVVPTVISCPSDKFALTYQHANIAHVGRFTELLDSLGEFGLGLYLEDKKSSVEFHSPANRFYEMLSAGLPMVFHPECMRMMDKAGYEISDFCLWQADEAPPLMNPIKLQEIASAQYDLWFHKAMAERETLTKTIVDAWRTYGV